MATFGCIGNFPLFLDFSRLNKAQNLTLQKILEHSYEDAGYEEKTILQDEFFQWWNYKKVVACPKYLPVPSYDGHVGASETHDLYKNWAGQQWLALIYSNPTGLEYFFRQITIM